MKYFKVFHKDRGSLVSSWSFGKAMVEYEIGKLSVAPRWLRSEGYGITVFASLLASSRYVEYLTGSVYSTIYPIYSVSVLGSAKEPMAFADIYLLRNGVLRPTGELWPLGTLMVDGVIPIMKISYEEVRYKLGELVD